MANTRDPLSLRLTPEDHARLQTAAVLLGIPRHTLAQSAIMAAVGAIEKAKGLALPIEFVVKKMPKAAVATKRGKKKNGK